MKKLILLLCASFIGLLFTISPVSASGSVTITYSHDNIYKLSNFSSPTPSDLHDGASQQNSGFYNINTNVFYPCNTLGNNCAPDVINITLSNYPPDGTYYFILYGNPSGNTWISNTINIVRPPFVLDNIYISSPLTQLGNIITTSVNITYLGASDTHTASWNWGDGNTATGTVSEANGSGTISNSHTYATPGVYTITLTVTDNHGASETVPYYQYVVVFDPSAGFFTGSGNYQSLTGWDSQDTNASGEVKLGIQAKYTGNNTIPTGHTKVTFKVGNLDFDATSYQWLVVSGAKATLKGNGTINGYGNYTFLFSGIDGSQTGGPNLVRVKITDGSNNVIYDTQPGAADTADPTTALTSGNIKVH